MKIITEEYNANVVELTNEELTRLKEEVRFQEFKKTRMPEIQKYKAKVIEYMENNINTYYADDYEMNKYLGYDDTHRYIMKLVEWLGSFDLLLEMTKKMLDEYGFEQVTFSILVVVIRDEIEMYGIPKLIQILTPAGI